jgi:hypothetical protein
MKKIVTIIVTFLTVNLSCAQEIEKLSPSMELMKLLKFENTLINTSKLGFAPFLNQLKTKGMPEEAIQELKGVSDIYFKQVARDPDLKKEMAGIYEEKFNKDELKKLITFYKSPLGQKSLQILPEMTHAGGKLGKKYAEKYSENFKENLTRIIKKYPRE